MPTPQKVDTSSLYKLPLKKRPPHWPLYNLIFFTIVFGYGCVAISFTQILFSPLAFFQSTKKLYDDLITFTKASFAQLCLVIIDWFAPVTLVLSADEGIDLDELVVRDEDGQVTALKLPQKMVTIANHQCYLDWMYLWSLLYFAKAHAHIFIIVMETLEGIPFKWIPIVGWGMQFYNFMFIKRSWIADRAYLAKHLIALGKRAQKEVEPFVLMMYPEGTLNSAANHVKSRKYAEKTGIDDMLNMLLPRSTGLFFCLRTLLPSVPNLALVDFTLGYAGLPPAGSGQEYYSLQSVFVNGIPPPTVHIHIRMWQAKDLPLGEIGTGLTKGAEASQQEKDVFDKWLLDRWREKDRWMDEYYTKGKFPGKTRYELPLRLKSPLEIGSAMSWFIPLWVGWFFYRTFYGKKS